MKFEWYFRKYEDLEQKKETLKEAFNAANKKDMQLLADMTNANNKRKSTKQLLAEEQNKLVKLEKIPEENQKVKHRYFITFIWILNKIQILA